MGSVRKYLFKEKLPDRESHHSRLFIDLAENIHIHHREYRTVFSLDEYFEYADIVAKSTNDVRNFLEQNPNYEEQKYPTTIMIAGGKERQLKFLKNSPKPNQSAYFGNDFAIELQDEFVTDEIHIHYRDFRIAMDRKRFRRVAEGFRVSLKELDKFEKLEEYNRDSHPDRMIKDFNNLDKDDIDTKQMGVNQVNIDKIFSNWYKNIENEWTPSKEAINALEIEFNKTKKFVPILLSTEKDGKHLIVDGHHRYYCAKQLGLNKLDAVVLNLTFEETSKIREAEVLLKQFDQETNYEYNVSSFIKSYLGYRLNRFYSNAFKSKMRSQKLWYRVLRKIKQMVFGKKQIFKTFNEAHNNHN
ncbi:MAG: ParB N-terminal domain-containing protein [Campylobacteraceae bacterium]|nr:ParB N-terminal domain-containing protein [Campylobacteraceae bacterium]